MAFDCWSNWIFFLLFFCSPFQVLLFYFKTTKILVLPLTPEVFRDIPILVCDIPLFSWSMFYPPLDGSVLLSSPRPIHKTIFCVIQQILQKKKLLTGLEVRIEKNVARGPECTDRSRKFFFCFSLSGWAVHTEKTLGQLPTNQRTIK
jgi:hypothetical protein